jgi:Uma2 family endonuclease
VSVLAARSYSYADEETRVTEPPVLTVEILSATQSPQALVHKIRRLLRAGVRSAWLVVPPLKTITVFTGFDAAGEPQSATYEVGETLRDASAGIEVAVADVFAPPPK